MNKLNITIIAASSLMASHGALAEYTPPTPIFANITPAYRTGDMHNFNGEEMVLVTQITATDKDGRNVVLFQDKAGAILPRAELENVAMLINPGMVEEEGEYDNLSVTLAGDAYSFSKGRIERKRLQKGQGGTVLKMQGSVNVGEYEVTSDGLQY